MVMKNQCCKRGDTWQ